MYVEYEVKENIGLLRLNRPRTNSLDHQLLQELLEAVSGMETEEKVTAVILSSKQPFGFSSGLDLGSFFEPENQQLTIENVYQAVSYTYQINQRIVSSGKIYVASLFGPVIGSAASLTFSCDIRIGDSSAWFWLPDPQYGGLLADGGVEMLSRHAGASRAAQLALTNDRVNAQSALSWGLLYRIVSRERLEQETFHLARRISGYSRHTLNLTKQIINQGALACFEEKKLRQVLQSTDTMIRLSGYTSGGKSKERSNL